MKLYVLIRKDLNTSQQAVQAGHAVSKIAVKHPEVNWDNQPFVYLKVSKFQLNKFINILTQKGIEYEKFIEPDIGNQLTAVSLFNSDDLFGKFNLL